MKILRPALDEAVAHAKESHPDECCGLLMADGEDASTVNMALRGENTEKGRPGDRYTLDHKTYLHAVDMEADGRAAIAGCYHSHPDGKPEPSRHDLERAAGGLIYLIVAVNGQNAEYAAWRLNEGRFERVTLEIFSRQQKQRKQEKAHG